MEINNSNEYTLTFELPCVRRELRRLTNRIKFANSACEFVAAAIEYLCVEVFFVSVKYLKRKKRRYYINLRVLKRVFRLDEEFKILMSNVIVPSELFRSQSILE